ncbi:Large exoprotein involved in heme utilization or adhesion [Candidatus Burkholderia verschuerenii]|uniref:Large exoprotein involved in heme utilization or adhesion n=1 Tax=Candidatus Burkholderia verschuerenii TaxID=242163 RepID=A0A0L0MJ20_9BURK|nr:filamentous hemagglutinin N-terminal domain-containing protein [Candidatus Burkholderia verschuerenii]KND61989.1 Large exoprotein involved in heme utilization or adhesion [Candidatus Burkholderia verschuerenii]
MRSLHSHYVRQFRRFPLRPLSLLVPLVAGICATAAHATPVIPQGGQFVAGSGTITPSGPSVSVYQSTPRGIIDWKSFSIGNGATVVINNEGGATLARVTGSDISRIDGRLSVNGSFYLVNPQGVVIGTSGVVTTGGRFVASAIDVSNASFMQGDTIDFAGSGKGAVVNQGKISSTFGDVLLISRTLAENDGTISAPNGSAELATADEVYLRDSTYSPQLYIEPSTSHGDAVNKGSITAAQIALQAADGNVFALAGNNSAMRATGTSLRDGHVWLVANKGTAGARARCDLRQERRRQRRHRGDDGQRAPSRQRGHPCRNVGYHHAGVQRRSFHGRDAAEAVESGHLADALRIERRRHARADDALDRRRIAVRQLRLFGDRRADGDDRQHGRGQSHLARGPDRSRLRQQRDQPWHDRLVQKHAFALSVRDDRHHRRFRKALIEHVNDRTTRGLPLMSFATPPLPDDGPLSIVNPGQPLAIVTLYTPNVASYGRIAEANFRRYCERHGYTLYVHREIPAHLNDGKTAGNWLKPALLREYLPHHEWTFWVDADVLFNDMDRRLESIVDGRDAVFARDVGNWWFNSGIMGFRRTQPSYDAFHYLLDDCAKLDDKSSVYANKGDQFYFGRQFSQHPDWDPARVSSFIEWNTPWIYRRPDSFMVHYIGMWEDHKALQMDYDIGQSALE